MKFGKTYMETMADPSFPKEWRDGALEYKYLKKLINGVVAELESHGLSADVLRELLVPPGKEVQVPLTTLKSGLRKQLRSSEHSKRGLVNSGSDSEGPDQDTSDSSPPHSPVSETNHPNHQLTPAELWLRNFSDAQIVCASYCNHTETIIMSKPQSIQATFPDATQMMDGSENQHQQLGELGTSLPIRVGKKMVSIPNSGSARSPFKVGSLGNTKWSGIGKKDLEAMRAAKHSLDEAYTNVRKREPSPGRHDWDGSKWRETAKPVWISPSAQPLSNPIKSIPPSRPKLKWVEGKFGRRARAEYDLGGTRQHPIPRIRLFIESPLASDEEQEDDGDDHHHHNDQDDAKLARNKHSDEDSKNIETRISELPSALKHKKSSIPEDGPEGESMEEKVIRQSEIRKTRGVRNREIVIPLTADTQFLDTLTGALQNLSNIQNQQKDSFVAETESLCNCISRAASPYASKNDLYLWREIFGLWMDSQIFESQREKDRGEVSVHESEARLKRFTDELVKRGWTINMESPSSSTDSAPTTTTMKGKLIRVKMGGNSPSSTGFQNEQSARAISDFLQLNVALLDVKRFQRVNVEAARKILKKHDKRTALTASNDFRAFMAQQEAVYLAKVGGGRGEGVNLPATPLANKIIRIPSSTLEVAAAAAAVVATPDASMGALTSSSVAHPSLTALLPSSTTGLILESLPHILVSLLTTTLLPILPSVDDYSCAICTSVAWRPIRLNCSHLFCIRCLVKLQRKGKNACPLCRCPDAVKNADGSNMDDATVNFLKVWFPREVAEKNRENEAERCREDMDHIKYSSSESDRCIIC